MSKRKNKNKTETVAYESPDRATLESALDSVSMECEELRAANRALYAEIDQANERIRDLKNAVVSLACDLGYVRGLRRTENNLAEQIRARDGALPRFDIEEDINVL